MHKPKIQIGREDMSRSAHTFLPKNKLVAGLGIGAIAMLAMAGPALTQETPKKDEVFRLTTAIGVTGPDICQPGTGTFFSFDISWFDPVLNRYFLADRNNKTIDVVDPTNNQHHTILQPGVHGTSAAATMTTPVPTAW